MNIPLVETATLSTINVPLLLNIVLISPLILPIVSLPSVIFNVPSLVNVDRISI